jgi:site-specific recombinase XerD
MFDHILEQYLTQLSTAGKSLATARAVRSDLTQFCTWWEQTHLRSFDLTQVVERDLRAWKVFRQQDEGAAPATINRGLSTLRRLCAWVVEQRLLTENPAREVPDVASTPVSPRSLPDQAVDALLRATRAEPDLRLRLRDEALLALLVYAGVRIQEACDVQLRDLDLASGTLVVRSGKGGKARRLPLHSEAQRTLARYLQEVRCPEDLPPIGSEQERAPLLVGMQRAVAGRPLVPGIKTRVARQRIAHLGKIAATQLSEAAARERNLERAEQLRACARQVATASPHQLRHSLARRMLKTGAQLPEVQRVLGHSRLSTTGIYLTPSEEEVRAAVERAGL